MEIPWIQLIINILAILVTALLSFYFSKHRYTFEKLHDRKLIYLEEIYSRIISLERDIKKYTFTNGSDMSDDSMVEKSDTLKLIEENFFNLQEFFQKKEIILEERTNSVVQSLIDLTIKILSGLRASVISQSVMDRKTAHSQWYDSFQEMENKFKISKEQLKKEFRSVIKKNYID